MRKILSVFILFIGFSLSVSGQEGKTAYEYLLLPGSAHTAALGGNHITVVEPDISIAFNNPALLGYEMDMQANISYMSYVADVGMGTVAFGKSINKRTTIGFGVNYTNYGKMFETTEQNEILGDLKASDITGNIFLSRDLTEKLRGGITAKFIYSNYGDFTSIGAGVDLGLSYYDPDTEFSWSIVGKNIGRQITAYDEEKASMPWDIRAGISKKLDNAPIRISLTALYLKQWKFDNITGEDKDSFLTTLGKHLEIGVDVIPTDNFWLGVGYNVKRGSDLKLQEGNKFGGLTAGAGLKVKAFSVGVAYGKFFPSANSFMVSLSCSFAEMKL
jgi:Protein of unknown function (DUF3308).